MVKAYAKINWGLLITGQQGNFHMLDTLMQTVDLYDEIAITTGKTRHTTSSGIEDDICFRAALPFFNTTGIDDHVYIDVKKNIPMQAGLGGGSSDGCQVLKELNYLYDKPLSEKQLLDLAQKLGADVPFFVHGGRQRAMGKGEELTRLSNAKQYDLVLAKPTGGISTLEAYSLYDLHPMKPVMTIEGLMNGLETGDYGKIGYNMKNSLEEVSMSLQPEIKYIKTKLMDMGAVATVMTGSGAAVVGLFAQGVSDVSALTSAGYWAVATKTI